MKKLKIILCFSLVILVCLKAFLYLKFDVGESKYNPNVKAVSGIVDSFYLKDNKYYIEITGLERLLVIYDSNDIDDLKIGNRVSFEGNFTEPSTNHNFNLFNYKKYLKSKGIYFVFESDKLSVIDSKSSFYFKIRQIINERLDKINNEYMYLFIMGNNKYLDSSLKAKFGNLGISHLFSISGMHISIFSSVLLFIISLIVKNKKIALLLVSFMLFLYLLVIGYTPSVFRSVMLFSIINLCYTFNINIKSYKIVLALFLFCIWMNPYSLYNSGFLFTYVISFTLSILSYKLEYFNNYFSKLFYVSLLSIIISLPIVINNYFEFNILTPLINLVMVPLISLIIFPLSLLTFIFPFLIDILNFCLNVFEMIVLFMSKFNLTIILKKMNIVIILIYYVIFITLIIRYKKSYPLYGILIIFCLLYSNINYLNKDAYFVMLDVGQGDSSLIMFPHNRGNILIDTGGYEGSKYVINNTIPYLKSMGVTKLDYLILTHGDYDHVGEAPSLVNNFKVKNIVFNKDSINDLENNLIKILNKKKIKYYKGLDKINLFNYQLLFLNTKLLENENNNSNVIYFKFDNYKFLLMGDAESEREKDILNKYKLPNIDFLKVGHHGSNTSSSVNFINQIKPKNALISVGRNNIYGHPKKSVIETLNKYNIYRTDLNSSIEIKINKNNYKIRTVN